MARSSSASDVQTQEGKYIIGGEACDGRYAKTVVKVGFSGALIFITVYAV